MNLLHMQEAIDYIEDHLSSNIDLEEVASIAACSSYHFSKIFMYLTDMPLHTYIRNRRMTLAAYDLEDHSKKVIDIALKYGYESPTAFNRAFKKVHGIAPSKVRKKAASLHYCEPITLNIDIKGNRQFSYRVEEKEAFRVIGVKETYKVNIASNFKSVPAQWFKAMMTGKIKKLLSVCQDETKSLMGISVFRDNDMFDYYIAVRSDEEHKGFEALELPPSLYAVFECKGALPEALQELQRNIIRDWLPASPYEYADLPDVEVYFDGDRNADDYQCQVWLPVVKKG